MHYLYRYRYIPFVIGMMMLIVGLGLKFFKPSVVSNQFIYDGGLITFLGFMFIRVMNDKRRQELEASDTVIVDNTPIPKRWNMIKEISIPDFDVEDTIIRVFDDNTSLIAFDFFPPLVKKLTNEQVNNFATLLSNITGVKVVQYDKDSFLIYSNQDEVINKVVTYLNSLEIVSYNNLIELTAILTNKNEAAIYDMTQLATDKDKFCVLHEHWCNKLNNNILLIFVYRLAKYEETLAFSAFIDWQDKPSKIISHLESISINLKYDIQFHDLKWQDTVAIKEVLTLIQKHMEKQGYKLFAIDTKSNSYYLFICKLNMFGVVDTLSYEMGFSCIEIF